MQVKWNYETPTPEQQKAAEELAMKIGVSRVTDAKVVGLPLWAILSTVGVWAMALLLVKLLLKFVFVDMDLTMSDEGGTDA